MLSVAATVALVVACGAREGSPPPPSALLVILDTVRADRLSCYDHDRETTPHLDRLAAEGERFAEAWSQSPWTLPAVATILTGQPPHVHGAGRTREGLFPLREDVGTLATWLAERSFRTAAFVNVVWCRPESGVARGFDVYDFANSDESNRGQRDARRTTDAALAWLESLRGAPFLLVVHYFDPHLTYDPPAPFDAMFEPDAEGRLPEGFGSAEEIFAVREGRLTLDARQRQSLLARYDGELRFVDEQFGRLREGLERLGLWDRTLVVVTADHGEEFWDHGGFEHGHSHHRELLRVPLIVRRPGGRAGVVHDERVRLVDVAPTVLDYLGLPIPSALPGRPLGSGGPGIAVAEGSLWSGDLVSARSHRGTLIWNRTSGERRYYAPADAAEAQPLPAEGEAAAALAAILEALPPERRREEPPWRPTEEQLEQLRSLGYVR